MPNNLIEKKKRDESEISVFDALYLNFVLLT